MATYYTLLSKYGLSKGRKLEICPNLSKKSDYFIGLQLKMCKFYKENSKIPLEHVAKLSNFSQNGKKFTTKDQRLESSVLILINKTQTGTGSNFWN